MSLVDPHTITIDTVLISCPKIESQGMKSIYRSADGLSKVTVSAQENNKTGRVRHVYRYDEKVIAADPFTSINEEQEVSVYVVIDEPPFGFTDARIAKITEGVFDKMALGDSAVTLKMLAEEH